MKNWLTAVILIALAVFLYFSFISPTYSKVEILKDEISQFDEALQKSRELQEIRDELLSKYNTFSTPDIQRLETLLPDNVDNVRLVLDIDGIASQYGLSIRNISVTEGGREEGAEIGPDNRTYGSVNLGFVVSASYDEFVNFVSDLERSLRLVDVIGISFNNRGNNTDFYDFEVQVRTYWLK